MPDSGDTPSLTLARKSLIVHFLTDFSGSTGKNDNGACENKEVIKPGQSVVIIAKRGNSMNVIWIVSDTFRRDHLGCYGNDQILTPSLNALAQKSILFERHYEAGFPTMPARADFLTGRWTSSFMKWEPIPAHVVTLPQILNNKGVYTAGVVDTPFFLRNEMNYDRGFRTFVELPGQNLFAHNPEGDVRRYWNFEIDRYAPRTFLEAAKVLEQHHQKNFFLYIDTWDPHEPWDAPAYYTRLYMPDYDGEIVDPVYAYWQDVPGMTEEKVKKAHATYCGEITMVDTWIGHFLRILENMGLMENTAIIFTTDHGYYFGEHGGLFGKKVRHNPSALPHWLDPAKIWARSPLYEEIVACPLLLYHPGVRPGTTGALTSAIDLMPTVLDIMGLDIPDNVEGHSLLPVIQGKNLKGREFVISTASFVNPGVAVRDVDDQERDLLVGSDTTITTEEWSLLYTPLPGESRLYHLPTDPGQLKNVIGEHPETAKEMHQMFVRFMQETKVADEIRETRMELKL